MAEHGGADGFEGFGRVEAGFGIEFVGVADQTFKECLRCVVADREGEIHIANVVFGDAGSCVALGDASDFFGHAFATEQGGTENTVTYVWLCAVTVNSVGVSEEYADVVEHGRSFYCRGVEAEITIEINAQGEIGDASAVPQIDIPKACAFGIVFVDYFPVVGRGHSTMVFQP